VSASVGRWSALYAVMAPALVASEVAFGASHEGWLLRALGDGALASLLMSIGAGMGALLLLGGGLSLMQQQRRPRRALGRARMVVLSVGGVLNALGLLGFALVMAHPTVAHMLESGLGLVTPRGREPLAQLAGASAGVGALLIIGGGAAAFGLLSPRARGRVWLAVDLVLLAAVCYAVADLPTPSACWSG